MTKQPKIKKRGGGKFKVSVLCLTYNHEPYIRQAIDSFLMQKTNFDFEILIYDDASTDETTKIISEYQKKYPKIIRLFIQKKNQYNRKVHGLFNIFLFPEATGEYIALCEGDDYWTDKHKLQTAVDTLDRNQDCIMFVHNTVMHNEESGEDTLMINPDKFVKTKFSLVESTYTHVSARVFRKIKNIPPGDFYQYYYLLSKGMAYYHNKPMSVYRYTKKGVWSSLSAEDQSRTNLKMNYLANVFLDYKYNDFFVKQLPPDFEYFKKYSTKLSWIFYLIYKGYDYQNIFNYQTAFISFSKTEKRAWNFFRKLKSVPFTDDIFKSRKTLKVINLIFGRMIEHD